MEISVITNQDTIVFIDSSSLSHPQVGKLYELIIPLLKNANKKLIVPERSVNELKNFAKSSDPILAENAKNGIKKLQEIKDTITIVGDPNDCESTKDLFISKFTELRAKNYIVFFCEDNDLRSKLIEISRDKTQVGKRIDAINISFILNCDNSAVGSVFTPHFTIGSKLTTIEDNDIIIKSVPQENDLVYDNKGQSIRLTEFIKAGGEGSVYKTNTEYVAKIYHKNKLTTHKKEKITLLTNSEIVIPGVCFPTKALYNSNKEFIGYLMPVAKGKTLDGSFFKGEIGVNRYFSDWTREQLVSLAITIIATIKRIHNQGLIIGDINGQNIMVVSPFEIYFVDTDSYQINEFPCPVGTETYTAPEIQGKNYKSFLRTMANENFAVATLVFKLMMFGKDPYAQIGGEGIAQNIKTGDFSYPFKEKSNHKIPDGDWKFFWSHLFFPLKMTLYNTFRKGECSYEPENRPNDSVWLNTLRYYKKQLTDGSLEKIDKESLKMFPKAYKKDVNQTYLTCKLCHEEVMDKFMTDGYCNNCLKKSVLISCKKCKTQFEFSNYRRYIKNENQPTYCHNCTNAYYQRKKREEARKSSIYETRYCTACNDTFQITVGEKEYFYKKGLDLPKRCPSCRQNGNYPSYDNDNDYDDDAPTYSTSSSWCFLTTVACNYYGKNDDCYELTVLRNFRDNWLAYQEGGDDLIRQYYEIAPNIVKKLKKSDLYSYYCNVIMNEYINPCIDLINSDKMKECSIRYIELVKYLENELKI